MGNKSKIEEGTESESSSVSRPTVAISCSKNSRPDSIARLVAYPYLPEFTMRYGWFSIAVALTELCLSYCSFGQDKDGFQLVRERDNIRIYERWVYFPKTDPPVDAREVKGVFYVKTTIDKAVALVRDESRISQWQDHVTKFRVYPHNDTVWYEYSYHDIPWPVSDQDHFLEYCIQENVPSGRMMFTFESVVNEKLAPVDEDATRMELSGSWLFEQRESDVRVTYRILSMPIGIPRIFTDPVIRSNMMSTIQAYVRLLENE